MSDENTILEQIIPMTVPAIAYFLCDGEVQEQDIVAIGLFLYTIIEDGEVCKSRYSKALTMDVDGVVSDPSECCNFIGIRLSSDKDSKKWKERIEDFRKDYIKKEGL